MIFSPSRRAALAGLLLLAGPAAAQGPPPPPPPPPASMMPPPAPAAAPPAPETPAVPAPLAPPAPAAPAVDPQVTALFKETIAAHQALKALTGTVTVTAVQQGQAVTRIVSLAYQKPNRAKIAVTGSAGPIVQFLSNGKTVTFYQVKNKTYQVQPVPPGTDMVPIVLNQANALLPRLLGHPEALNDLLIQPGVTAVLSPAATPPKMISGTAVDTVVATLPAPDGSKGTFTFDIGHTDHLLRQVAENASLTQNGKPQAFTLTETVTALSAAPTLTAADFVFTPPPGTTKLTAPKASQAAPPMHDPRLVPGAAPLPFTAKDLSGKPLSLAQYKGKVVLMDFWATWCGPCVGEMPNVIADYKKYHAQGFDIVGVSLDQNRPALTSFIAQNKMPWRQIFDGGYWNSAVPHKYGVRSIPFGLLVGRDGKIAAVDVRGPALETAIQQALSK